MNVHVSVNKIFSYTEKLEKRKQHGHDVQVVVHVGMDGIEPSFPGYQPDVLTVLLHA